MRLVRQYNDIDCGIAVAAMVCKTSWTKALEADLNPDSTSGLTTREFMRLCRRLGKPLVMHYGNNRRFLIHEDAPPPGCCAMLVRRTNEKEGHYVAISGTTVFDPGCVRPIPWSQYRKRRWKLARLFIDASASRAAQDRS